ncbi:MAG TPA: hypothetical protein VLL08_19710 [Kineosporiaceae bacterium]|nr:hypothetical protein [Kineosporiaceae bacterium]
MLRQRWFVPAGLALALSLTLPAVAVAAPTAAACSVTWGSQEKSAAWGIPGTITNVRTGKQDCYDRLVVDVAGNVDGYVVRYVDQIGSIGSGEPIPVRGGAKLLVVVFAPAHDENYKPTFKPANVNELSDVSSYPTFRQVVFAGSFEGVSDFGVGVRARLPFRVFILDGPGSNSRLVMDVAHHW